MLSRKQCIHHQISPPTQNAIFCRKQRLNRNWKLPWVKKSMSKQSKCYILKVKAARLSKQQKGQKTNKQKQNKIKKQNKTKKNKKQTKYL